MDLPGAMPEEVKDQIIDLIGCSREDIIPASGKTGMGVPEILSAIIERVPSPKGDPSSRLQRSEEHTSDLQSLMRISYAVFCLKKKTRTLPDNTNTVRDNKGKITGSKYYIKEG